VLNRLFHGYEPWRGDIAGRRTGVLISNADGEAVAYALSNLEERGPLMIEPGARVYQGMIVGEHSRAADLEVNVLKGKKLSNVRAAGKDDNLLLTPPMRMTLERALSYIAEDELVEVTPQSIRIRKKLLLEHERKKASREKA
jgi:GTP-binding protein